LTTLKTSDASSASTSLLTDGTVDQKQKIDLSKQELVSRVLETMESLNKHGKL
jgi:hypothetical protein